MSVRSGQSITVEFTTRTFSTGAATNADSTPTGTLYVNGTADAATVTVTNLVTGVYKAAVTLPTLAVGDVVDLRISATVSSITDNEIIWRDTKDLVIDSAGLADANTVKLGPSGSGTAQTARDIGLALPAVAPNANGGLPILSSSGTTLGYTISTLTTYTGNTPQTGDSFARIGATGSGLTSLAPASTALSTAVWTAPPTGFLVATFPGTVASTTNITAGTITTVTNLTNLPAITTNWLTAAGIASGALDAVWSTATRTLTAGTNIVLVKGTGVTGFTDLDASGVRSAVGLASANLDTQLGTIAGYIDTEVGAIYSRIGAPAGASIAADIAAVKAETAAIVDDTGTSGVVVAAASKTGYTLSSAGITSLWTTTLTQSYAADGAEFTAAQALYEICQCMTEFSIGSTTITVKKRDGATTAATFTLDSATSPTSRTRIT